MSVDFESSWEKDKQRKQLKEARENCLSKAKARYEREEEKKEAARLRGEGTWMLPTLADRLEHDEQEYKKMKKKKKKEKKKKEKKKKEKKKEKKSKKKKKEESSSSDSDSSDDRHEVSEWVEASSTIAPGPVKGPRIERDSWMTAAPDIFPSVSRDELRQRRDQETHKPSESNPEDEMGQHSRELNPYWKDGGTGIPAEQPSKQLPVKPAVSAGVAGDFGVSWLRKAYSRCQQEATEQGRSLEEVAGERYGSLEELETKLAEAERSLEKCNQQEREERDRLRYSGRNIYRDNRDRYRDNRDRDYSNRDRDRDNRDRDRDNRDRDYSNRERHHGDRHRNPNVRDSHRGDKDRDSGSRESSDNRLKGLRSRFMKPDESSEGNLTESRGFKREHRNPPNSEFVPSWKKKSFVKPSEETKSYSEECRSKDSEAMGSSSSQSISGKEERKAGISSRRSNAEDQHRSSSESSSDSSDQSDSDDSSSPETSASTAPPVKVLTEGEMNELGAKIVRAELMGDLGTAQQLKAKLQTAREMPAPRATTTRREPEKMSDKEGVVLLTKTDRYGVSRPVPGCSEDAQRSRGRRRKNKVETHSKSGERERYFADDDKHSLTSMVARERSGTTEDSNLQFARLAARVQGRVDDDDYDDTVLQRAGEKDTAASADARNVAQAKNEHKWMSAAMDKCHYCFENVAKHLIIAIGFKVYLCVPSHRSIAEGHCLIVPMQHTSQGTILDEDVWHEIQVFRKGLTAMFASQDEDCVFMETAMRLKKFPHMVVECVPLPRELGDMAPIYFKKAIIDSETEWAQNKKLVDLSKNNIRRAVPRGFPYFSVDFGLQGGFAHVIEDEHTFPFYFGREILGGMLDLDPTLWRKPHKENFESQRVKVLQFANMWKPFDWTEKLKKKSAVAFDNEGSSVEIVASTVQESSEIGGPQIPDPLDVEMTSNSD